MMNPSHPVSVIRMQVWVKPELRGDGLVYWAADSDSQLTKGLAALLVNGLSGCTPQEILQARVCLGVTWIERHFSCRLHIYSNTILSVHT